MFRIGSGKVADQVLNDLLMGFGDQNQVQLRGEALIDQVGADDGEKGLKGDCLRRSKSAGLRLAATKLTTATDRSAPVPLERQRERSTLA